MATVPTEDTSTATSNSVLNDAPRWMSTSEAAQFLGVNTSWLERRRMSTSPMKDRGPAYTKLGGHCFYLAEDLLTYLRDQKVYPGVK